MRLVKCDGHMIPAGPYLVERGRTYVVIDFRGERQVWLDRVCVPPMPPYPETVDTDDVAILAQLESDRAAWRELLHRGELGRWIGRTEVPTETTNNAERRK